MQVLAWGTAFMCGIEIIPKNNDNTSNAINTSSYLSHLYTISHEGVGVVSVLRATPPAALLLVTGERHFVD